MFPDSVVKPTLFGDTERPETTEIAAKQTWRTLWPARLERLLPKAHRASAVAGQKQLRSVRGEPHRDVPTLVLDDGHGSATVDSNHGDEKIVAIVAGRQVEH